jgi:heat shock protein HslJ
MCRVTVETILRRCALLFPAALAVSAALALPLAPALAQKAFPYDAELRLEAQPMPGTKRVPGLQVSPDGAVEIDLWCVRGRGRALVDAHAISIVPSSLRDSQCSQDSLKRDEDFLRQLTEVTSWRWEGTVLVLDGPQALRWRPASN